MIRQSWELLRSARYSSTRLILDVTRISPNIKVNYLQQIGEIPSTVDVDSTWSGFQEQIRREAFIDGVLRPDFLRTEMLRQTVGPSQYRIGQRIVERLREDQFGKKLLLMVTDPAFGEPFLLPTYPLLSSVGAQNLYYIYLLNSLLKQNALEYEGDFVDFGGGYGYFARAMTILNDIAGIHILDLPIMGVVQRAFHEATLSKGRHSRIKYYDAPSLQHSAENLSLCETWLSAPFHFNATFSLSECDRNTQLFVIENIVRRSKSFLIIYAGNYHGVDNELIYQQDILQLCKEHTISHHVWQDYSYGNIVVGVRK